MICYLTAEEHSLYLLGCRCGADPKGPIAKTAEIKKAHKKYKKCETLDATRR